MNRIDRRFTLLDAMALVAATAVGLSGAMVVWMSPNLENFTNNTPYIIIRRWQDLRWTLYFLYNWLYILSPVGAAWTVALSLLALRKPRLAISQLVDRPGVSACWTATLVMMISCGLFVYHEYRMGNYGWEIFQKMRPDDFRDIALPEVFFDMISDSFRPIGCSVFSVWAMAVLGKRWSHEANWIDRSGVCLGMTWVSFMILLVVEALW
jgi:hypothetical protein